MSAFYEEYKGTIKVTVGTALCCMIFGFFTWLVVSSAEEDVTKLVEEASWKLAKKSIDELEALGEQCWVAADNGDTAHLITCPPTYDAEMLHRYGRLISKDKEIRESGSSWCYFAKSTNGKVDFTFKIECF